MPKLRLSYDGWLAMPAAARRKLGLHTGYQLELELELIGETIVLRPARSGAAVDPAPPERPKTADPAPDASVPPVKHGSDRPCEAPIAAAALPAPAMRRGPGRPRKVTTGAGALPPTLKARGRRAAVRAAE